MSFSTRRIAVVGLVGAAWLAVAASRASGQINMGSTKAATKTAEDKLHPPDPSAPRLLVGHFHNAQPSDGKLGVDLADKVREHVQNAIKPKDLWVIPRELINKTLKGSSYPEDTALGPNDLKELSKFLAANEVVDATTGKTSDGGVRLDARFYFQGKPEETEIFQPVTGKSVDEVAKAFADVYMQMRKMLAGYTKCRSALLGQRYDEAASAAHSILSSTPTSGLAQACLLSAYYLKSPANHADSLARADSLIRYALQLSQRDSSNTFYPNVLFQAYAAKGDQNKAAEYAVKAFNQDQANTAFAFSAVNQLMQAGAPEKALVIVDQVLVKDPTNTQAMQKKLSVLLTDAKTHPEAFQMAKKLLSVDSSAGTSAFFVQMASVAKTDSNPAMYIEFLQQGAAKYGRDTSLWLGLYDAQRVAGNLKEAVAAATHVLTINPKHVKANQAVVYLYRQLGWGDSVFAFVQRASKVGLDSVTMQGVISNVVQVVNSAYQALKKDDKGATTGFLQLAQRADSIAPQAGTKFFIGVAAGQLGTLNLQDLAELAKTTPPGPKLSPADREKVCTLVAATGDLFDLARNAMGPGGGGRFNVEAASQVMGNVMANAGAPAQLKTAYGCK